LNDSLSMQQALVRCVLARPLGTALALIIYVILIIGANQTGAAQEGYDDHRNMTDQLGVESLRFRQGSRAPTEIPTPRTDSNSTLAHAQLVEKARKGGIDLYFVGDSIVRRWGTSDPQYAELLSNWKANFFGWNAGNFGWGADKIENILWRLRNGELDGINRININLARLADGKRIRFLNVNDRLADRGDRLFDGMMNAGDKLHPTVKGYQV